MFWAAVAFFFGVPILLAAIVQLRKRGQQPFYAEAKGGDVTEEADIPRSRPVV